MDDSPGANRIELASTSAATRLQLGHLLLQRDNQRLQSRGHGFDLVTSAHGALRAGSGLLLSAHGRPSSTGAAQQMDSREPQAALDAAQQMAHTLAASAQKHDTKLANEAQPSELLAAKSCKALRDSLNASDGSEAMADDATSGESRTGGGLGRYATFARPDLVFAAPGGVSWFTPASTLASADGSVSLIASQDITATVQRNFALAARSGIVWFTDGQAQDARKPNTETGIKLHAATGSVSVQAASAKALVAADKKVEVASTTDAVMVGSPLQVLLNGSGSSIRIAQGSITLSTSGLASFRAAMKELTGAASANSNLTLAKPGPLKICEFRATSAAIGSDALVSV
jgi:type VI secretion system secreted protein VgrG